MNIIKYGFLLAVIFLMSCKHKAEIPSSPEISFATEVKPIIINNCARSGCHDMNGDEGSLTDYYNISDMVTAGDASNSELYNVITNKSMPPDGPLTNQQAKLIYIWIMQGAKNN